MILRYRTYITRVIETHSKFCARQATRPTPAPTLTSAAFSLIEVVLAIGVAGAALLVIFSLLPVGLGVLHDADRQIVENEIFNTISSELSSTPFTQLDAYKASARFPAYYDVEGLQVKTAAAAVYTVRCTIVDDTDIPANAGQPAELRRATISIGFHKDPLAVPTDPTLSKRGVLLVNRGT